MLLNTVVIQLLNLHDFVENKTLIVKNISQSLFITIPHQRLRFQNNINSAKPGVDQIYYYASSSKIDVCMSCDPAPSSIHNN